MKLQFVLFITFLTVSSAFEADDVLVSKPVSAATQSKDFNERLDTIIKKQIEEHLEEWSPLKLENYTVKFEKPVGFGILKTNVTGVASLNNITLSGLTTIKRVGDAFLAKTKYGNTEMKVTLAIGPLNLNINGLASLLGASAKMAAEGKVDVVEASATLHFHPKTEEVYVKDFSLGQLKGLNVKVTKYPLFFTRLVMNQFIKVSLNTLNPVIKFAISKSGVTLLQDVVVDNDFIKQIMKTYSGYRQLVSDHTDRPMLVFDY